MAPKTFFLALTSLALAASSAVADPKPLANPLVFVKYVIPDDPGDPIRGNLHRLDPDGTVTNLTRRDNVAVRDPEVSWDARRVVFSMRVGADTNTWQVYEIGVDGSGLRRVSRSRAHNDLDPSYLPDGRILFTTDRLRWSDGYENVPTTQLAVMDRQGRGVEVLKRNHSGHLNPLLGSDGMVYMTQWDFHDRRVDMAEEHDEEFDVNRFLLWKVFADGSGLDHPAFGAHTLGDFTPGYVEVRERPTDPDTFVATFGSEDTQELTSFHPDRLIFVPGSFLTFEGASLVLMKPRRNQRRDRIIYLTPRIGGGAEDEEDDDGDEGDDDEDLEEDEDEEDEEEDGDEDDDGDEGEDDEDELVATWRSPLPLVDGRLVASRSPGESTRRDDMPLPFQLWILDGNGSSPALLYEDPGQWCLQAVEVVPKTPPAVRPGVTDPRYPYAILNAFDVTLRERDGQPRPRTGQITEVRVYREDLRTRNTHDLQVDDGVPRRGAFRAWDDPDTRVIGTAPVHGDESFAVVVPADTPLTWELLDAAGNVVVRERFGTELRTGEVRQCAGCHAPHNGRTGSTTNFALDAPTNLTGRNVDLDGNGVVDLLEGLCETQGELCALAPFRLRARASAQGAVELRWRTRGDTVEQFIVFRKSPGGNGFEAIATLGPEARRFRDHGARPGEPYVYRVEARGRTSESRWSNRRRVTIPR